MDCDNKECTYYDKKYSMRCRMDFVASLDTCAAYKPLTTEETDAKLKCSDGVMHPSWAEETMMLINKLTPDIKGKAFDPDWFMLRQRFEEAERVMNEKGA